MKQLLAAAFSIFCLSAYAQTYETGVTDPYNLLKKFQNRDAKNDSVIKSLRNYLTLENKKNMIVLPQDHMPCLVPDTKDLVAIPNAWGQVVVPYKPGNNAIPNPQVQPPPVQLNFSYRAFDPLPFSK